MALDISIEDRLFELIYILICLWRYKEIVTDDTLPGETFHGPHVCLLHLLVHFVKFCENMANERLKDIIIFNVSMVFWDLLQDKLCCIIDLVVVEDKTDVHNDQDDIALLEVKVYASAMSDHSAWRIHQM